MKTKGLQGVRGERAPGVETFVSRFTFASRAMRRASAYVSFVADNLCIGIDSKRFHGCGKEAMTRILLIETPGHKQGIPSNQA